MLEKSYGQFSSTERTVTRWHLAECRSFSLHLGMELRWQFDILPDRGLSALSPLASILRSVYSNYCLLWYSVRGVLWLSLSDGDKLVVPGHLTLSVLVSILITVFADLMNKYFWWLNEMLLTFLLQPMLALFLLLVSRQTRASSSPSRTLYCLNTGLD